MELGLKQKYALVTGGSRGIGRSIALGLAQEGCLVAICARGIRDLERTAAEINAKGVDALAIAADVSVAENAEAVIAKIADHWGTLHVLVNNAGGGGRWGSEEIAATDIDVG